ncbi:hypothetical protein [Cuniculiplasma divulgatum]|uniref:Uncharacterized protein n=1 Tax=Cuniculiplasma divulgatum TaxID=1673428 RepID=A0A1R4A8E0_9ARCH|nr:hypothetical protein [Cuniculiplasma divulgatum]SJK85223.1 hypothetical protein CPM_1426 [Cuniculiplasma divulgatum]
MTAKVNIAGNLPNTFEGVQLALENAERLFNDSQQVSIPTKVALLEIGLEEIAKTWGIFIGYEKNLFERNPQFLKRFLQLTHIKVDEYNKEVSKISKAISDFFDDVGQEYFSNPFDTISFSNHDAKIEFLSKFIKYIREIQLPILRTSSDRGKLRRDILGRYLSKSKSADMKKADEIIDDILDIDDEQLGDIVSLKEYGLYLHVQNDFYISPNARSFEMETLENLLALLIGMAKNEVSLLSIVLLQTKKNKGESEKND